MAVRGGEDGFNEGVGGREGFFERGNVGDGEEAVEETGKEDEGVFWW